MKSLLSCNKNLLGNETSPYLLQHASNPVHWHSWNDAALELAKQHNKPILLSIGYSACHWCHVMAHESFEDQQTADVMNTLYVCIKVDKEERPDLDKIYQNAHSLLTERPGGWPLTVFLTPDTHMPIFAGTYFPKHPQHSLPAFTSLLQQISEVWRSRQPDIAQQSSALQSNYQAIYQASKPGNEEFTRAVIDIARNQIEKQFDPVNGGFSGAPKFPHPALIEFAIRHWCYTSDNLQPDARILHCALFSLQKMADGGIFDHLGGGFCRYSTDTSWMIPHFEKMLYDNGPLLSLYSQAWKLNATPLFFDAATQTADWVIREMQSADGGYYSAQDADSEGSEGKFFVWSQDELNQLLDEAKEQLKLPTDSITLFKKRFGLDRSENFEGNWHLHGYQSESALSKKHGIDETGLHLQFHQLRQYLFQHRENRIHPETDHKILCAWNGLMIHGMAIAGRLLDRTKYTESARAAAFFIKNTCWKNGKLYAGTKDGRTTLPAYVDDYAFLIYGLLELLQSQWDNELYDWALTLADTLLSDFEDTDFGGFYFTSHQHEKLIQRLKSFTDDAIPSGNAIAALALTRLGYLSGKQHYIAAAENCLKSAWSAINHAPISHSALLTALGEYLSPPAILLIRSHHEKAEQDDWSKLAQQYYLPTTLVYNIPVDVELPPSLSDKLAGSSHLAYPCRGTQCQNPIINRDELLSYLRNNSYRVLE